MAPKDAAVQEGLKLCLQGQMQLFHQLVYLTSQFSVSPVQIRLFF